MTDDTPGAVLDWPGLVARKLHVEADPDSHVEEDTRTFHPSQLSRCKRQACLSKFGLDDHDTTTLGTFRLGTMIHEWLEESFRDRLQGVEFEKELHRGYDGPITITGRCDVYDSHGDAVYDFKTRSGWYRFDPPNDAHLDQVALYADMVGADHAQVVYVSKKTLEVKTWPEDGLWTPSQTRVSGLLNKAREMAEVLEETGTPGTKANVPFEPCDCWLCDRDDSGEDDDDD